MPNNKVLRRKIKNKEFSGTVDDEKFVLNAVLVFNLINQVFVSPFQNIHYMYWHICILLYLIITLLLSL